MTDGLHGRLGSGAPLLGTFLSLGSPLAAEACALAGFDWLLIDREHGAGGEDAFVGQLMAASSHGVPAIVRTESAERIRAGRVLDAGAAGVMFPRLDTPSQVEEAVSHLHFPPAGDRGVATYNRACGYGLRADVLTTANESVVCVVQIETAPALENVDAIARIPGVDVIFIGPRDLSYALGVPGQTGAPAFRDALQRVAAAAQAAGIAAGILAPDRARAEQYVADGFTFVAVGSDCSFISAAASAAAAPLHATVR